MLYMYLLTFVQILLESFPISSSGHLQLLYFFCTYNNGPSFLNMNSCIYEHIVHIMHIPTAIIIALFFYNDWQLFFKHPLRLRFIIVKLFFFITLTDGITTLIYFFLKNYSIHTPLSFGFFVTTIMLFSLLPCSYSDRKTITWSDAVVLGIVQGCALLPGISRFAATFVAAVWLGLTPQRSFLVVWMMQWPLIIGANIRSISYFIARPEVFFSFFTGTMFLVIVLATCVSYYAMYCAAWMVKSNRLWIFGLYEYIPFLLALFIGQ